MGELASEPGLVDGDYTGATPFDRFGRGKRSAFIKYGGVSATDLHSVRPEPKPTASGPNQIQY